MPFAITVRKMAATSCSSVRTTGVGPAPEASGEVIIDNAARLHGRVCRDRAGEAEAAALEQGRERLAGRRPGGHVGEGGGGGPGRDGEAPHRIGKALLQAE